MKLNYFCACISLFILCNTGIGQIVIDASDIAAQFAVGTTQRTSNDTLTGSFDIGSPGGGNHWDFSALVPHVTVLPESVDPASTPFFDQFPAANITIFGEAEIEGIRGDAYTYSTLDDDFLTLGLGGIADLDGLTGEVVNTFEPPQLTFDLPFTVGDAWNSQGTATIVTSISGIPLPVVTAGYFTMNQVDAYGTLVLPGGNSLDALRVTSLLALVIESEPGVLDTSAAATITFHSKSGEFLAIASESASPPASGIITGTATWTSNDVTAIETVDAIPAQFELKQNYPNPFNPSTTIEYSIPEPALVNLRVFDVLGKEVAVLKNEKQAAGTYRVQFEAGDLPSGIYLVRMASEGFSQVRKISLMR